MSFSVLRASVKALIMRQALYTIAALILTENQTLHRGQIPEQLYVGAGSKNGEEHLHE